MKLNLKKPWQILIACPVLLVLSANPASAKEEELSETRTAILNISAKDLTRIIVKGGRVARLQVNGVACEDGKPAPKDMQCELITMTDSSDGSITVRPLAEKQFRAFMKTNTGAVYPIILQPAQIPLETIILKEPSKKPEVPAQQLAMQSAQASSLEVATKRLINAIARNDRVADGETREVNQYIQTAEKKDRKVKLKSTTITPYLIADVIEIENQSDSSIAEIDEHDWYFKSVAAVGIDKTQIPPHEFGHVFVIRFNNPTNSVGAGR